MYHHGNFNHNRMLLTLLGIQFHIKSNRCESWGEHPRDRCYNTRSKDHYRWHLIFVKATRANSISDTILQVQIYHPANIHTGGPCDKGNSGSNQHNQEWFKPNDDVQINSITRLSYSLMPGYDLPVQHAAEWHPRVQQKRKQHSQRFFPCKLQGAVWWREQKDVVIW